MKLGPLEIILILIIVGVILLVFRGMPGRRAAVPLPPPPPPRVRRPTATEIEEERIKTNRRNRLRWLGGAFIIIGLVVLGSTLQIFDAMFMMLTGSSLIILLGIIVLFLSARR